VRDGVVIAEADLNLCRQVMDTWGFRMTARYSDYARKLAEYNDFDFTPQVIRDPTM
jgi:beta-ureidopropionase